MTLTLKGSISKELRYKLGQKKLVRRARRSGVWGIEMDMQPFWSQRAVATANCTGIYIQLVLYQGYCFLGHPPLRRKFHSTS